MIRSGFFRVVQIRRDPDLSLDRVARVLNCSKRHLHNAFSDEDDTLGHYFLHRRLQDCMRGLNNPLNRQRTITAIEFFGASTTALITAAVPASTPGCRPASSAGGAGEGAVHGLKPSLSPASTRPAQGKWHSAPAL